MTELKSAIEEIVDARTTAGEEADFNMSRLQASAWPLIEGDTRIASLVLPIRQILSAKQYSKLGQAILRNVFLIELVKKPAIETTKFRYRWIEELRSDPRGCSFDGCMEIAIDLLSSLPGWLNSSNDHKDSMLLSFSNSLIPYEAPIDYLQRRSTDDRLHIVHNMAWVYDPLILRTLKLRKFFTDKTTSPDATFFKSVITDKIKVKTYLTDRVLTGDHKTNREKRWETHPNSVHFAERRVCMAIEYTLITQICAFQGFPTEAIESLKLQNIISDYTKVALCPITGDPLSYLDFRRELLNPQHGKSDFQVGHLNPLKLGDIEQDASGHTAENISWISADGNRIQGSLSLEDVRILIQRISENYTLNKWWPGNDIKPLE